MRRIEKTNRTFAKLVLTAVILFLLIIAAEHGTMTVLAEEPADSCLRIRESRRRRGSGDHSGTL